MKKTSTGARLTSAMMACVLALSMCGAPAAYAIENSPSAGENSGEGFTSFTLQAIDGVQEFAGTTETEGEYANPDNNGDDLGDNLAFTVPTQINYIANKDGELLAPTNVTVQNHSDDNAYVSSLKVDIDEAWDVAKSTEIDETDLTAVGDNTLVFKVGVAGDMLEAKDYKDKNYVRNAFKWSMTKKGTETAKLPLAFEGKVYNLKNNIKSATQFGGAHWYLAKGKAENVDAKAFDFGEGATYDSATGKVSVENGYYTVSAAGWDGKGAAPGDVVTLTFGSDGEYHIDTVTVKDVTNDKDVDVTLNVVENTATFTMPNGEISIAVTFAEGTYNKAWLAGGGVGWRDSSSWEDIAYALNAHYAGIIDLTSTTDMGTNAWKVGDTKAVTLSAFDMPSDESICDMLTSANKLNVREKELHFAIVDIKNHDDVYLTHGDETLVDGKNPRFIVQQVEIGAMAQMNTTSTNAGGWKSSRLREHLLPTGAYYKALEKGFTDLLKTVKVPGAAGNKSKTVQYSEDKLFLPAENEVFGKGTSAQANTAESTLQWKYYETDSTHAKKTYSLYESTYNGRNTWWERSPSGSDTTIFCFVSIDGSIYSDTASNNRGLAPAGCI